MHPNTRPEIQHTTGPPAQPPQPLSGPVARAHSLCPSLTDERSDVVAGLGGGDDLSPPVLLAGEQTRQRRQRRAAAGVRNGRQVGGPRTLLHMETARRSDAEQLPVITADLL